MRQLDAELEIRLLEAEEMLKQHQREGGLSAEDFDTAMVLLTAVRIGPATSKLADALGLDEEFVRVISTRMRNSGLWSENAVSTEGWFDDPAFPLLYEDLQVAIGRCICIRKGQEVSYINIRGVSLWEM